MLEYAYTANDNELIAEFRVNDIAQDLSDVTKLAIEIFNKEDDRELGAAPVAVFDSVTNSALFDITDMVNGIAVFKPGPTDLTTAGLSADTYYARWIFYSTTYVNGIIWGNELIKFIVAR